MEIKKTKEGSVTILQPIGRIDSNTASDLENALLDILENQENKNQETIDEDEFNPTLAAMEEEIKPQVISTINSLCKDYVKLNKIQNEKLDCALNSRDFLRPKEKNYQKRKDNKEDKLIRQSVNYG